MDNDIYKSIEEFEPATVNNNKVACIKEYTT
jgi:hypothetical protein